MPKPLLSPEEVGFAAGMLDGEGTVMLTNPKDRESKGVEYPSIVCRVYSTDYELVDWFKDRFGGSIYTRDRGVKNWKIDHRWHIANLSAVRFLEVVSPYVVSSRKRERIEFLLRYGKTMKTIGKRYSCEEKIEKQRMYEEYRERFHGE